MSILTSWRFADISGYMRRYTKYSKYISNCINDKWKDIINIQWINMFHLAIIKHDTIMYCINVRIWNKNMNKYVFEKWMRISWFHISITPLVLYLSMGFKVWLQASKTYKLREILYEEGRKKKETVTGNAGKLWSNWQTKISRLF